MSQRTVLLCGRSRQMRRLATRTAEDIDSFQRPRFLYLTGGQRKVGLIQESFWRTEGKTPTFLPEAHAWGHYRQHLCERFGGPKAELSGLTQDLLIGRLWNQLRPELKYWAGLPDSPSTRKGLTKLLEDWQQSFTGSSPPSPGFSPNDFPFTAGEGNEQQRIHPDLRHDLWLLARTWTDQLDKSTTHTDRAGATRQLLQVLQQRPLASSIRLHLSRFTSLVVDDLLWLPPPRQSPPRRPPRCLPRRLSYRTGAPLP